MPRYRRRRAARKIQRRFRRYRARKYARPTKQFSAKTGSLTCFQHTTDTIPISASAAASTFVAGTNSYSLSSLDLAQVNAFQRLFKWYRIKGIKQVFTPVFAPPVTANPAWASQQSFTMFSSKCRDSNDLAVAWADQEEADNESNSRRSYVNMQSAYRPSVTIKMVPRTNDVIFASSGLTALTLNKPNQWISSDNPSVEHAGIKYAFLWEQPNEAMEIQVRTSFLLQFRGVQ